jgi:hypothetical protein
MRARETAGTNGGTLPTHQTPPPRNPLWISAGISVGVLFLTHILQLLRQTDLYFLNRLSLGYDFKFVWDAAVRMSAGVSPYVQDDFVWPPFFPWLLWKSGMMGWGFAALAEGMFFLSLGCLLLSCHLANRLFSNVGESNSDNVAPLLLILFSSFPVYFLLDRGNLDGVTMAFMWGGLWLGFRARSSNWQALAGGLLLALGIGTKFYPIVLLVPLFLFGRIRIIIGVVFGMALIVAADRIGWRSFVTERLWSRLGTDWSGLFNENASLEAFFLIVTKVMKDAGAQISELLPTMLARITAAPVLAIALGSTFLLRHDRDRRVQLAWIYSFIPISLGTPSASLAYALTNVIPLAICGRFLLARYRASRHARTALLIVFVGIGLSQFQAIALAKLAERRGPTHDLLSAFCSVGLFLTVVGLAAFQAIVSWPTIKGWALRLRSAKGAAPAE